MDAAQATDVLSWFHGDLGSLELRRAALDRESSSLQPIEFGPTSDELGAQYYMMAEPPTVLPWVQIDLQTTQSIDSITVVPAMTPSVIGQGSAFAFPPGFRIDVSDDADFASGRVVYRTRDLDENLKLDLPVVVRTPNVKARYIRITITELAQVAGRWTYALGEVIVLSGNRNVAIGSDCHLNLAPYLAPAWHPDNLVDGRTPLGMPMIRNLPPFDGIYTSRTSEEDERWMMVDLGNSYSLDEIRLHPIHARQGAAVPGYGFPRGLRVELASDRSFDDRRILLDTSVDLIPNPGNNPVTFLAHQEEARFIKLVCTKVWRTHYADDRFGLSEVEVYSDGVNVARDQPVTIPGEIDDGRKTSMLTDGFNSNGRIIELPEWIDRWDRLRQAKVELSLVKAEIAAARRTAQMRLRWSAYGMLAATLVGGLGWVQIRRRQRRHELLLFREQLARDLHDEIGSNLAAMALLGEVAPLESDPRQTATDWGAVHQMASECTDALRDTLWLLRGRNERGGYLPERLHRIAQRMLPHVEIDWNEHVKRRDLPSDSEMNRELFLAFKEVLANIAKHAQATELTVNLVLNAKILSVSVSDNGIGFTESCARQGMGLTSIEYRLAKLGGTVEIQTEFGRGTTVRLNVPMAKIQRRKREVRQSGDETG